MVHFSSLQDLAVYSEALLPPANFSIPNGVVYTNVTALNPQFGAHLERDIYIERPCSLSPVILVSLPENSVLLGGGDFVLVVGDAFALEHYPVYFAKDEPSTSKLLGVSRPEERIAGEAMLIARYGIYTWGHWLGELLPKVVLSESAFPERFSYLMPYQVFTDPSPNLPWIRIKESLAAYGVDESRVIPLYPDKNYRFSNLYSLTSVWSDHMIHPEIVHLMRSRAIVSAHHVTTESIAILRLKGYGRAVDNFEELAPILKRNGFSFLRTGGLPFQHQVSTFMSAKFVFGVLGSDLTNLIYSPPGVRVISVAPATFGDRFFYALVLSRNGKLADLRGSVTRPDSEIAHKSSFRVETSELEEAIRALGGS